MLILIFYSNPCSPMLYLLNLVKLSVFNPYCILNTPHIYFRMVVMSTQSFTFINLLDLGSGLTYVYQASLPKT